LSSPIVTGPAVQLVAHASDQAVLDPKADRHVSFAWNSRLTSQKPDGSVYSPFFVFGADLSP
jgi:hypothetical protein